MNRKRKYKDLLKWKRTVKEQRHRYYRKTQNAKNSHRAWTKEEIDLIMRHEMTDSKLAVIIGRSLGAIQQKRCVEKKKITSEIKN